MAGVQKRQKEGPACCWEEWSAQWLRVVFGQKTPLRRSISKLPRKPWKTPQNFWNTQRLMLVSEDRFLFKCCTGQKPQCSASLPAGVLCCFTFFDFRSRSQSFRISGFFLVFAYNSFPFRLLYRCFHIWLRLKSSPFALPFPSLSTGHRARGPSSERSRRPEPSRRRPFRRLLKKPIKEGFLAKASRKHRKLWENVGKYSV